ncbi:hypothetical protein ACFL96_07160 [Thermoproteota archaeon]
MEHRLEIVNEIEKLDDLDDIIAILNLPDARLCAHGCPECITSDFDADFDKRISIDRFKEVIDFFHENYDIKWITRHGYGDVFHRKLAEMTLDVINYSSSKGIKSFIFTAGDNLYENVCNSLAENQVNIMISLLGNPWFDAEFFNRKQPNGKQTVIADNIRRLIMKYQENGVLNPEKGKTRIGLNYVGSEDDVNDETRLKELKIAANDNGLYFLCNTNFNTHPNPKIQEKIVGLSRKYADFNHPHSILIRGQCRMGARSAATVNYKGTMYNCPYLDDKGDGNFFDMTDTERKTIIEGYKNDTETQCGLRGTKKN